MQLKRHEYWRQQYRQDRYMEYLSTDDLIKRAGDILRNIYDVTENSAIRIQPSATHYWMIVFTHVLEEGELRKFDICRSIPPNDLHIPNRFATNTIELFKEIKAKYPKKILVKFGKTDHLKNMLECGKIRINPASFYSDPSLNSAQKDDELTINLDLRPSKITLTNLSNGSTIKPIGNIRYTVKSKTDYYVYCLSSLMSFRLFSDFGANCCLVISEPEKFTKYFIDKCKKKLSKNYGWRCCGLPVKYIDPLNTDENNVEVYFTKHFKYWYQNEYRIVFLPNREINKLDILDVEIGNLSKFCTLFNI